MKLTSEQQAAVRCDENLMLTACPGSGKTRVIISKLVRILDTVRDTAHSVACITYTNAAVHEIEGRVRFHMQPGDDRHYDICTIHSFCLNHIFRPFCYLIAGYKKGFKVLTPESEEFEKIVTAVSAKFNKFNLTYRDFEEFTQLRIDLDGEPTGAAIERGSLTPEIAKAYWARARADGFIDFANIIYYSLLLIRKRPEILSYVAAKFSWILVDEFQDTTDLQVEILALIAGAGDARFLLVGDPLQSIYRFAGARPDLAVDFAKRIGARTDIVLSGNFRSSNPIVAQAEKMFARTPAMKALGEANKFTETPHYRDGSSSFVIIRDYFLPALAASGIPVGEAVILAPTWFTLFPLGRLLREYGVSIVGPGARPYRRNRQFAPLAEQICGYLMEPRPESIVAIERTLFNTVLDVTGRAHFDIFSYEGRAVVFRLLAQAQALNDSFMGAIEWLESSAAAFSKVLVDAGYFSTAEQGIFAMSVEEMKTDMRNNRVDLANLAIDDLGIYANPDAALKLSTLHNAKGREFTAVAMIDLNEGRIPSYYSRTTEDLEEQKRLFYVGITRAKRILFYATDNSDRRNGPSRFLLKGTGVGVC
ncbi:ATP-dependent helicase [Bradyrhizobium lablabi]|uniref:ATP-dependent helicase n=1 Tax=Bradyrhizobium lablabi TaxID=722472 RepID=UPI00090AA149|nr:ATP-dependent helicase [Bradyrhizobium lablabi]SHL46533.1 DNA helicase-2 / ATP-dependent DNA helicase PcrA [Bradyrhizobium lablabi]